MTYKIFIIIFLSNLFSIENSMKEDIKKHLQNLLYYECNYQQEKILSEVKDPLISTGELKYKQNEYLVMEQKTPFEEIYYLDKKNTNQINKKANQLIFELLNGDILENRNLIFKQTEKKDVFIINMTVEKGMLKKYIRQIDLFVSKKPIVIKKIQIETQNGDITKIDFYAKK